MKALFSAAYFPPIAWIAAARRYDTIIIEAKETYPKQTYRNRTEIMTAGGIRELTVPVIRNNHSRTDEVRIDYRDRWSTIHMRTLTAAYSASPYFQYYSDEIEHILGSKYATLLELDIATIQWLLKKYKIKCGVELTSDWAAPASEQHDFRYTFTPKRPYPADSFKPYYQVFSDRIPFTPNLSAIDLLMNLGTEAKDYIESIA